jgi:hypothetical protein
MTLEGLTFWLVIATAVLVVVTFYYAVTTHRILGAMQGQAEAMREQSRLLAKSAQVAAWAGLVHAAVEAGGPDPRTRVKALALELEALEQRLADQPHGDR